MNRVDFTQIIDSLADKYGIDLKASSSGDIVDFRPDDLSKGNGFVIRSTKGWRSISAEFVADSFAAHLIRMMGEANQQNRMLFCSMAEGSKADGSELLFRINGNDVDVSEPSTWPTQWNQLQIKLIKVPIFTEELSPAELQQLVQEVSGKVLAMTLCLLLLKESVAEEASIGLPEGALSRIEVNRYERSGLNREACVLTHGHICKVCDFDFQAEYGMIGQGFIHIHHVIPVSQLGSDYFVNPTTDLVPVCPNCHAILHKKNPPYTVAELKKIMQQNSIKDSKFYLRHISKGR